MTTFKKILALLTLFIFILSCKTNSYSFLNSYPTKILPVVDSTNFSNHVEGKLLSKKEQVLLGLPTIFIDQLDDENAKVGVSYLPKISESYTSVVYYFYANNNELSSVLVNYDKKHNIINHQIVAYDEIADGLLKTTSTIYKDSIVLNEYISDSPSTMKFIILDNGDITRE
ncbi:hypothetical protein C7447_101969 [Tenacibaculum adriaticum]|uniref:Lipoprotein n=1 Tax=Tenacibaculum adriaticum TaxID=413713 RepID=A0A5S5DZA4_9FLAO|nr:hypothetical protein [Tenacibaculum adriaticum]TYQ00357.1 hypothetical protein C7447_101969 [Tenacibaculum adriaticum]